VVGSRRCWRWRWRAWGSRWGWRWRWRWRAGGACGGGGGRLVAALSGVAVFNGGHLREGHRRWWPARGAGGRRGACMAHRSALLTLAAMRLACGACQMHRGRARRRPLMHYAGSAACRPLLADRCPPTAAAGPSWHRPDMRDATLGAGEPGLAARCTWGMHDTARLPSVAPIVVSCTFRAPACRQRRRHACMSRGRAGLREKRTRHRHRHRHRATATLACAFGN
jgi:hypothetical protein